MKKKKDEDIGCPIFPQNSPETPCLKLVSKEPFYLFKDVNENYYTIELDTRKGVRFLNRLELLK